MSLTVATARRQDTTKYSTSEMFTGVSVEATLTRDYDEFDPSLTGRSLSTSTINIFLPEAGVETGTMFVMTYDSDGKYCYQEFTYDAALTIAETAANRLTNGTKYAVCTAAGGWIKLAMNAGTGTANIRLERVKS
jgi:hypothetical protein